MLRLPVLIYNNHFNLPSLPPRGTFDGKHVLVTGATSGLGFATAAHFVNLGAASVIITARTAAKGDAAKAQLEIQTGTKGKDIIKVMELDMDTLEATKTFIDKVKSEIKIIDYVVLNAGVYPVAFKKLGSSDDDNGWESSLQVNVLSTALLAILLLPWMKTAGRGQAHLTFVTSGLHTKVSVDEPFPQKDILEYFNKEEHYPKGRNDVGQPGMYAVSKLLEHYVVNEIVKLATGPDGRPQVIVNPVCPGLVKSDLARGHKTSFLMSLAVDAFLNIVPKTTEGGARSIVLAAVTAPSETGKNIRHYGTEEEYNQLVEKNITGPQGRKIQAEVWREVLDILGKKYPKVKDIALHGSN
ncbi:hypothetical protein F5884DRAFT_289417 [Xylogone sp. PMI_703]|nr:hypothetical protein F5884DRAFT_289417 [Xylogone sp. PMI_703]